VSWDDASQMYREQLDAWLAYVRGGSAGPLATLADGLAALRVVDAVRESSLSGEVIRL
jgi:predicted dehydrogenase